MRVHNDKGILMKYLVLFAVLLAGCAANRDFAWTKPGATQQQFLTDKQECEYEALKNGGATGPNFGQSYGVWLHKREIAEACMRIKGYEESAAVTLPQKPFKPVNVDLKY